MNILLRREGALGDVLQSTPIARRLRRQHPDAWICVETQHTHAYFKNPDVSAVGTHCPIECDLVVDLDHAYERRANMHAIDAYMLEAFGDTGAEYDKTIWAYKGDAPGWVDRRTVVLHPNVSWPNRTLSRDWWITLANELQQNDFCVAITGTGTDHDLYIIPRAYDTRGGLPLYDQAALIDAAGCLVCGDSSMFVLVGATETPAVGLCTISRPEYFMPYRHGELGWRFTAMAADVPCYGCRETAGDVTYLDCRYGTNACVTSFSVERVVKAVKQAMQVWR